MFPIDDVLPPAADDPNGKLLRLIATSGKDVAKRAVVDLHWTRQAVNRRLRQLEEQGVITAEGQTRGRQFKLVEKRDEEYFVFDEEYDESTVWRRFLAPKLQGLTTAFAIAHYAFTEIYNNAIDHSESTAAAVTIVRSAARIEIGVIDSGIGIFHKLQETYGYKTEQEAVLELVKGRLTTDPNKHTGWGIFFTSRMCDHFAIYSGHYTFSHDANRDWNLESAVDLKGTTVSMMIDTRPTRTVNEVLSQYVAAPNTAGLNITHVPLSLAQHGQERLISRSQAKSVTSRFDWFKEVLLDFSGVEEIGQAFADEIFRVWQREHPEVRLVALNTTPAIDSLITAAQTLLANES